MSIRHLDPARAHGQLVNKLDKINHKRCKNISEKVAKKATQLGLNVFAVAVGVGAVAKDILVLAGAVIIAPVKLEILVVRALFPGTLQGIHRKCERVPSPVDQMAHVLVDMLGVAASTAGVALCVFKGSEWNVAMQKGLFVVPQPEAKKAIDPIPLKVAKAPNRQLNGNYAVQANTAAVLGKRSMPPFSLPAQQLASVPLSAINMAQLPVSKAAHQAAAPLSLQVPQPVSKLPLQAAALQSQIVSQPVSKLPQPAATSTPNQGVTQLVSPPFAQAPRQQAAPQTALQPITKPTAQAAHQPSHQASLKPPSQTVMQHSAQTTPLKPSGQAAPQAVPQPVSQFPAQPAPQTVSMPAPHSFEAPQLQTVSILLPETDLDSSANAKPPLPPPRSKPAAKLSVPAVKAPPNLKASIGAPKMQAVNPLQPVTVAPPPPPPRTSSVGSVLSQNDGANGSVPALASTVPSSDGQFPASSQSLLQAIRQAGESRNQIYSSPENKIKKTPQPQSTRTKKLMQRRRVIQDSPPSSPSSPFSPEKENSLAAPSSNANPIFSPKRTTPRKFSAAKQLIFEESPKKAAQPRRSFTAADLGSGKSKLRKQLDDDASPRKRTLRQHKPGIDLFRLFKNKSSPSKEQRPEEPFTP